jgi:hypothetical protein
MKISFLQWNMQNHLFLPGKNPGSLPGSLSGLGTGIGTGGILPELAHIP